jgi:hypothetical protein
MCLKNKTKRGPKKGFFPLLKVLKLLLREMRLFSQSFSVSQGRLEVREKSILNDCYFKFESKM